MAKFYVFFVEKNQREQRYDFIGILWDLF
jgi:hypothetical protein